MHRGQILIDHSTVPVPETRRLGNAFTEKGIKYLDAPVSGGADGADAGKLRIFVGGDYELYELCRPMFEAAGNPDKIHYYGQIGMGQTAKVVQQLTVRLPDMARLEVMAFGIRGGLDKEGLMNSLDVAPDSGNEYAVLYRHIEADNKEHLAGLFSEWAYYIKQVRAIGMKMPMLEGLYEFARHGEWNVPDPLGRPQPCIWDELMKYSDADNSGN
jgi:3-hydroxyisobutyrate dehydrogenase-like beta-hydroxyacid dehydrogenase